MNDTNDTSTEQPEPMDPDEQEEARRELGDAVEQVQLAVQAEREKRAPYVKPTVTALNPGVIVTWNNGERGARFPDQQVAAREALRQRSGLESIQIWDASEFRRPGAKVLEELKAGELADMIPAPD